MNAPTRFEDYVDRVRPAAASNMLLWATAAFVVVFFIWAGFTELDRTVRGSGRISPDLAAAGVSNLEGGIVDAILVKTGSVVRRGDPLVRLDRTATGSALSSSQAQYDALLAKIARLEAEVSGHPPAFPAPGPAGSGLIQQVEIEQSLYRSRLADLASLSAAGDARVAQSRRSVAEANATLASRRAALTAAVAERDTIRPLVERGIEPRMSLVQAESQAAIAQADVAAAAASIDRAQSTVAEAEAMRLQQRQDWRARAAQELAAAQADMVALQRQLPELSARVQRTVVRSPVAGRVNRVLVSTVGGTVAPGAALVEIVPGADELIVEAQVLPKDIAWVRTGQSARIRVSAYDAAVYGALEGRVISISPDATQNERSGESFYTIRVATSEKLKDREGHVLEIGPGMVAEVDLLGDKRTILQYLLTPFTRLTETAFREQ